MTPRAAVPFTVLTLSLTSALCAQTGLGGSTQEWLGEGTVDVGRFHHFVDVTADVGIDFFHEEPAFGWGIGSGAGWIDYDQDDDEDLLVLARTGDCKLYRNDGGQFVEVPGMAGISLTPTMGPICVSAVDYDGDSRIDVFIGGTQSNALFRNVGGAFQDVTTPAGLEAPGVWTASASWADFDLDGDLDLYLGNYVDVLNFPYHFGEPNLFYENRGPASNPWFVERAAELGVDNTLVFGLSNPNYPYISPFGQDTAGCALSTCTNDYDEDGDPDIHVGNDFGEFVSPNKLYRNDTAGGSLAFTDVSVEAGLDDSPHFNMGIAPIDYDHDGDWDFYESNLGDNVLLQNQGDGTFVDVAPEAGVLSGLSGAGQLKVTSWGILADDLDNDGWEDLLVVNGFIPAAGFITNDRAPNHLYINSGDGTFEKVPDTLSGIADRGAARGMARADYDGDGLLDFFVVNNRESITGAPRDRSLLFRGLGGGSPGNWLEIDLVGRFSQSQGIGSRLDAQVGGTVLKRQVLGDGVFISSPTRMVHFGLGEAASVDRLDVRWASGVEHSLLEVPAGTRMDLVEPAVVVVDVPAPQYTGSALILETTLQNLDTVAHLVSIEIQLRDADGNLLIDDSVSGQVPAGATVTVPYTQPLPPAIYQTVQGDPVVVRSRALCDGGEDVDELAATLP